MIFSKTLDSAATILDVEVPLGRLCDRREQFERFCLGHSHAMADASGAVQT